MNNGHDPEAAQGVAVPSLVDPERVRRLHGALLPWYEGAKRDLPWRRTRDPYAVWLSEVMLQQTRVETVIPYYERFLAAYPTVSHLAEASLEEVLGLWSGLGYYRRARMLHATAAQVHGDHAGAFPASVDGLRGLHGVGAYTAGAVASIAFGLPAPLVDGNVVRVLSRLFCLEDDMRRPSSIARVWAVAGALVPATGAGAWNQALMELGATVCVPREPRCLVCPARDACDARARGIQAELPRLSPKAKPTRQRRLALVVAGPEGVLLVRRKPEGTFGGMWEPPTVTLGTNADAEAVRADAGRRLMALSGLRASDLEDGPPKAAGTVVHVLSHRRLEVDVLAATLKAGGRRSAGPAATERPRPVVADEYDAARVWPLESLGEGALTTFARKLLAKAQVAAQRTARGDDCLR